MIVLGRRIRLARQHLEITQEQLAEKAGVSRTAITRWESGLSEPTVEHLIELCNILNVDACYLLGVDNRNQMVEELQKMSATLEQILSLLEDSRCTGR